MGIPFTRGMGFLFTTTMGKLFTMTLGIQLTVSSTANWLSNGPGSDPGRLYRSIGRWVAV